MLQISWFETLMLLCVISGIILWIWTLMHIATRPIANKRFWIVIVVLLGSVGAIVFLLYEMITFRKSNPLTGHSIERTTR